MTGYRRFVRGLLLAAAAYILIGNVTWIADRYEVFPIFAWELFSYVPDEVIDYGVRITQVDGAPLQPPRYFEEAVTIVGNPHSIEAYVVIQSLGRAVESGDAAAVVQARTPLESLYLGDSRALAYELYWRRAVPLERIQQGVFIEERLLASFVAGVE